MKSLFEPLVFRTSLTAPNRVVLAPMTNKQSHTDGAVGEDELRWLVSRAEGGFGTVTTCAAHVALDGQGWPGELGIHDDALLPGLILLATALHAAGAVAMVQIFHGGARADRSVTGGEPWSASEGEGFRAATESDLARVTGQFAAAALRAKRAGFDGVEIHGAHGYLLTQFLSATQNHRLDRWGGSWKIVRVWRARSTTPGDDRGSPRPRPRSTVRRIHARLEGRRRGLRAALRAREGGTRPAIDLELCAP